MLVELITCRALGLMRIAHLQSISSARTHELNTITFTHLTQLHITILRAVLRVTGEPTEHLMKCSFLELIQWSETQRNVIVGPCVTTKGPGPAIYCIGTPYCTSFTSPFRCRLSSYPNMPHLCGR
jgi:hypothetical protein